jgi:predicted DNA-binding protein (MmcQ/YjbR family)
MTAEEIRKYCLKQKGTTESIKWEDHLCFSVGDKMYLVLNPDPVPISASFKTSEELYAELPVKEGIIPAPYMARHKWLYIDNIKRLPAKQWMTLIDIAYKLVYEKLPAKTKKRIQSA